MGTLLVQQEEHAFREVAKQKMGYTTSKVEATVSRDTKIMALCHITVSDSGRNKGVPWYSMSGCCSTA